MPRLKITVQGLGGASGMVHSEYRPAASACPSIVTFLLNEIVETESAPGCQMRPERTSVTDRSLPRTAGPLQEMATADAPTRFAQHPCLLPGTCTGRNRRTAITRRSRCG